MIRIFYGEDRETISQKIKREFLADYEVFEGENLKKEDLPSIFFGVSLFSETRKILIKDLSEGKGLFEEIEKYLKTPHNVVVWETKMDKRTAMYKNLKALGVEMFEYKLLETRNKNEIFDIFEVALFDGRRAVKMLERIQDDQDPFMFLGLLSTQAIKKIERRAGEKEKRVLKELSKLDILTKTTAIQPWTLIKSFLFRLSSL